MNTVSCMYVGIHTHTHKEGGYYGNNKSCIWARIGGTQRVKKRNRYDVNNTNE